MAKSVLGKGLKALIDPGGEEGQQVLEVPLERVKPNPEQPRQEFDQEKLAELASSIREHGVIQPLIVCQEGEDYLLVAGERRWRAAALAGMTSVPVIIRNFDSRQRLIIGLIENLQREDLNPLEEAEAYQKLLADFSLTQEEVASVVGKSRSTVANTLRLLALPREIQESIAREKISAGHARALLALPSAEMQKRAWQTILRRQLSVRGAEKLVQRLREGKPAPAGKRRSADPLLRSLENQLIELFGTQVRITRGRGRARGKIEITYFDEEDLTRIIELLGRIGA